MKLTAIQILEILTLGQEHGISTFEIEELDRDYEGEVHVTIGSAEYRVSPERGWTRLDLDK